MCGIAGLFNRHRRPINSKMLKTMSHVIRHRGPDDLGYLGINHDMVMRRGREAEVVDSCWLGLAQRRLSIIDLSEDGWQPMVTADRRYAIVYNGEVYNYVELRDELRQLGHRFHSTSDTEVILLAYAEWGTAAFPRFVGMFAFTLIDIPRRKLVMVRDHFGIKPLYYSLTRDFFAFASEIKALLEIDQVSRQAHSQSVFDFVRYAQNDYGENTFFLDVKQLPPASYMEIDTDSPQNITPVRYWSLDVDQMTSATHEEASETLRSLFMDSVNIHLRSDVPVGAALSGGIDSSSVVGCIRALQPDVELHTFSYVPDTPEGGERRWINDVRKATHATAHYIQPDAESLVATLDELVYIQDQPMGSTNMYAQYLVYKLAKQHNIKVVLDGQGADEMMAGYPFYYAKRLHSLLRKGQWGELLAFLRRAARTQPEFRCGKVLTETLLDMLPAGMQKSFMSLLGHSPCPTWISSAWLQAQAVAPNRVLDANFRDLRSSLRDSLECSSIPMLLRWQDRNSMAHSVESRVPFLNPKLAEFLFTLPDHYLIAKDGTTKSILRTAMRDIVPESVLMRRDKVAFGSPMLHWMRILIPWISRLLASDCVQRIPLFDHDQIKMIWQEVAEGRRSLDEHMWRWISLIKWVERYNIQFEEGS